MISQRRWDGAAWQTRYHQYDALGSTIALTDETGAVTDSYTYDAWGNEIAPTSTFENPFRWIARIGYYWDQTLNSYYVRRRTYVPTTARWLSQDPLSLALRFSHLYQYASNTPNLNTDASGLESADFVRDYTKGMLEDSQYKSLVSLIAYKSKLTSIRLKHSRYAYYQPTGMPSFFDGLDFVAQNQVSGVEEFGWTTGEAEYGALFNSIVFSNTIAGSSDNVVIKETIHAWDDMKDWYLSATGYNAEKSEALGYAAFHTFNFGIPLLQHLENRIWAGRLTCAEAQDLWQAAWTEMAAFGQTDVNWGTSFFRTQRQLTADDVKDLTDKTGLHFSCEKLRPIYDNIIVIRSAIFQASGLPLPAPIDCPCRLRCPANLPEIIR